MAQAPTPVKLTEPPLPEPRYSYGGDEFLFCELDVAMSFRANFKALAICRELEQRALPGIVEIAQANASYVIRYDPDDIAPQRLLAELQEIHEHADPEALSFRTRVFDIPAFYNDPWTHEILIRFRERHQEPTSTDIQYATHINGYKSVDEFIAAHSGSPWFVSMVGFVAGLPFLFQLVERARQIEVPKYLRPRTDTPKLTIGHGGCFGCIYSVRGAGGYQMLGITPAPIFDPAQGLPYFKDFMCLFRPGDIIKFKAIDRESYDGALKQVETGTFNLRIRPVAFAMKKFLDDPVGYNHQLEEVLYGN